MPWGPVDGAAPSGQPASAAGQASATASSAKPETEEKLGGFLKELDATAKADSVWTSEKQIHRLTKPGSKYLNLNPYEVLQIEPDTDPAVVKKQTRKLQFLVHPDRNRGENQELAKKAFEAVGEAKRMLEDETKMSFVGKILDEAKEKTKFIVAEKRTAARKAGVPGARVEEDDPIAYKALYAKNSKMLFAEYAKRKEELENEQAEAKRKNEEAKAEAKARQKREREESDAWDAGRDGRINNWRDFSKRKKKKAKLKEARPPKLKTEQRPSK